jgi:hypothetical protein
MNNKSMKKQVILFVSIMSVFRSIAQTPDISIQDNNADVANAIEQKAEHVVAYIQSNIPIDEVKDLKDLARESKGLKYLQGKDILPEFFDALLLTTNEEEIVYLGSILIQAADPSLDDEIGILENSDDILKKTVAAHYFLQNARDVQDTLRAYDILAQVATAIAQMPQANLSQIRSVKIRNIVRDTNHKFMMLGMAADLPSVHENQAPNATHRQEPCVSRYSQMALIEPWWQKNRIKVLKIFQSQQQGISE